MVRMDNQIKQQGSVRGVGSNPALIIDSYEMKGPDGYIIYDDTFDTRAEVGFIGGEAVRADGPGKKIIETPWLKAGTIRDNTVITISYETSKTGEGTAIASGERILEGRILKRNPNTQEIEKSLPIGFWHKNTINKNPGISQSNIHNNSYATQFINLTPQHEYKIELFTTSKIESHHSIIIDYLTFDFIPQFSWTAPRNVGFSGEVADDIGGIPGIPLIEGFDVAISTDGSGNGSVTATQYTETTAVTSFQAYNYFYGTFNSIDGIAVIPTGFSGTDSWSANGSASTHPAGGYDIVVGCDTGFGATTVYAYVIVVGQKAADQV